MTMGSGNKFASADFITLKARVKAEMNRRNGTGGLTTYAGVVYDYSVIPVIGGKVKLEHYSKIRDVMATINPATVSLPTKIVSDKIQAMNVLEANMTSYEAKARGERSTSDCASSCTGMCISACTTSCSGSCTGSCASCSGCSGCGGCDGSCSTVCNSTCSGGCQAGCQSACASCSSCGGCDGGCIGSCQVTCTTACWEGCAACTGCYGSV